MTLVSYFMPAPEHQPVFMLNAKHWQTSCSYHFLPLLPPLPVHAVFASPKTENGLTLTRHGQTYLVWLVRVVPLVVALLLCYVTISLLLSLCSGRLADMGALSVCPAIFRGSCVWSELLPLAQVGRLFMGRRGLPTRPTSFSLSSCQSSFKPHGFTVKQIVIKLWVHRKAAALFPK